TPIGTTSAGPIQNDVVWTKKNRPKTSPAKNGSANAVTSTATKLEPMRLKTLGRGRATSRHAHHTLMPRWMQANVHALIHTSMKANGKPLPAGPEKPATRIARADRM